jgi:hypothetical protein
MPMDAKKEGNIVPDDVLLPRCCRIEEHYVSYEFFKLELLRLDHHSIMSRLCASRYQIFDHCKFSVNLCHEMMS